MGSESDDVADSGPPAEGDGETMHIHKPKAAKSLREFLSEISVIVVGIAIALTGEQVIESFDWGRKVADTRKQLAIELGVDLGQAEQRIRTGPCVEARLDELAAAVDEAARTGRLAPLGAPNRPPFFTWETGVWQSAMSAQTVTHMGRTELKAYTAAYSFIDRISDYSRKEDETWASLYGLVGPGRRFEPAEAAAFRQAIGQARFLDRGIRGSGLRARQLAGARGLPYDKPTFASYADTPNAAKGVCQPISTQPPAHYGAAPFEADLNSIRTHPITVQSNGVPAGERR